MRKVMLVMKPDILLSKEATEEQRIEFTVLKVVNRISKMGKDAKWVFDAFDEDGSKHRK